MATDKILASKCSEWHIRGGTFWHIIELSELPGTRGKVFYNLSTGRNFRFNAPCWFTGEGVNIYWLGQITLKCVFKCPSSEKTLWHWLQGYGFSPVCILKCVFKTPPCEKALGHWLQRNGFSPVCILKCFFKTPPCEDTDHKEMVFHLCAFLSISSKPLHVRML